MRKVTIITPTYNRADKLPRLYNSLQNQTFKEIVWLIMDDGSTDDTKDLVRKWQLEGKLEIDYHYHANVHKVITMFRGFDLVKTDYHFRVDSDDELPSDSVEILYNHMLSIQDDPEFCAVIGRLKDQSGNINGTDFPENPLDTTAFLMKNQYKVRGVHAGMQKTAAVKSLNLDMEKYIGKGYLPDFWNYVLDSRFKTRFINDVVYTYHFTALDGQSNTNARKQKKHTYGLMESHLMFVRSYYDLYFRKYPLPILKQLFKYLYNAINTDEINTVTMIKRLERYELKFMGFALLIPAYLYNLLKPMK